MARLTLRRRCATLVEAASLAAFAAWSVGRVLGDAWVWSQWLFWIPSITVLASASSAFAVRWVVGAPVRAARLSLQAGLIVITLGAVLRGDFGVGLVEAPVGPDTVRVLQWNTNWPSSDDPRTMAALGGTPADIVLISNRGAVTSTDLVRRWAGADARVVGAGPFALVTRWPVRKAIQVSGGGGPGKRWWVARFEVLPPAWEGQSLRIAMVDLPSRPSLSRSAVADALLQACEEGALGEVDLVAGDFNATDGSVILTRCFPGFRDALREAGRGWLATWPRQFPLWRIDHVLVTPEIEVVRGRTVDPGISSHRMTEAWLRRGQPAVNGSSR